VLKCFTIFHREQEQVYSFEIRVVEILGLGNGDEGNKYLHLQ
jgi:hypothetical protein